MEKHTPGPWDISWGKNGASVYSDATIAQVPDDLIAWAANARLIAAAPDLLAACKWLAAWDGSNDDAKMISEACSLARAAICKVEGK